jgi:pilus assembly protein CpaE
VSPPRPSPNLSRPAAAAAAPAQRGQASVELLGVLPLLIALGLAALQLLAVGYASILAGNAAEAGALALAGGSGTAGARAGVREALPGWSHARTQVSVDGGRVTVRLRPPSLLQALAERLEVTADASVEAL